jgi:hypothetical protein
VKNVMAEITNERIYEEFLVVQNQISEVEQRINEIVEICRTTLCDLWEGQKKIDSLKRKHGF